APPVRGALALVFLLFTTAVGGRFLGVGPLAGVVPPDQVTDPGEMIARSLQATLDAASVHVVGTLDGALPGALLERSEVIVDLAGTTITADLRPRDARTHARVTAPALDVNLETITVWTTAWYRSAGGSWRQVPVDDATSGTGVDINPLTLVDRVRSYLATTSRKPWSVDVPCGSASGRCHEVRLDAGTDPGGILAGTLPGAAGSSLPAVSTVITLQADALTLRPAALTVVAVSADGTLDLRLTLAFGNWDGPVRIDEPAAGDVSPDDESPE
ncbi:MAG: hypothetical protein Q8M74_00640, partial [Chloroflexota bacterium]|nr:hypothetical protein [Chloroflexota bacterium]